jgi:hypothetical protein
MSTGAPMIVKKRLFAGAFESFTAHGKAPLSEAFIV